MYEYKEYKDFRCIFLKDNGSHIKAKDYNGVKYKIIKNDATKGFKEGLDDTFYAVLKIEGLFKTRVLYPIKFEAYLELKNNADS